MSAMADMEDLEAAPGAEGAGPRNKPTACRAKTSAVRRASQPRH
jgi:hypothetical protein